jgi:hypothetical protein
MLDVGQTLFTKMQAFGFNVFNCRKKVKKKKSKILDTEKKV